MEEVVVCTPRRNHWHLGVRGRTGGGVGREGVSEGHPPRDAGEGLGHGYRARGASHAEVARGAGARSWRGAWVRRGARMRRGSVLAFAGLLADGVDDVGVGERRHVPKVPLLGDITQQAPHDLARARLGQIRREHDLLWPRELPDHVGHVLAQLAGERVGRLVARPQDDVGEDRLPRDWVGSAHDRRLRHGRMRDQS